MKWRDSFSENGDFYIQERPVVMGVLTSCSCLFDFFLFVFSRVLKIVIRVRFKDLDVNVFFFFLIFLLFFLTYNQDVSQKVSILK